MHRSLSPRSRSLALACALGVALVLAGCDRYTESTACADAMQGGATGDFAVADDGVAQNRITGTRWFRCSAGQRYVGGVCRGQALEVSLDEALAYAEEFSEISGRRWRLPTLAEMDTLAAPKCENPYLNSNVFPDVLIANYWASDDAKKNFPLGCVTYTYNGNQHCRQHREEPGPFFLVLN